MISPVSQLSGDQVKTMAGSKLRHSSQTAITVNSANTDITTFANLPSKYRVLRLICYGASISLTTATVSLFTDAAAGGTAIVSGFALSPLTATTKFADATLAVTADYQTAATLYVRNVAAQGAAATCSFLLEYVELP